VPSSSRGIKECLIRSRVIQGRALRAWRRAHAGGAGFAAPLDSYSQRLAELIVLLSETGHSFLVVARETLRVVLKAAANWQAIWPTSSGKKITVREEGRSRRISKQRALIKSVMAKALLGNVRATTAILALYARLIVEPADDADDEIQADELQIIKRFAPRLLKSIKQN
jgi:hypothetical protein